MAQVHALACMSAFAVAALVAAARAAPPGETAGFARDPGWRSFVDPDRGTRVAYPAGVFSVDAGAPERGSGQVFRTSDGRARLIIYTLPNEERRSPQSYLKRHLVLSPGALEYTRVTRHFFALSGVRDDEVFYSRCNFPRHRRGDMGCIFLQYPQRETKMWDAIVTRISLSLRSPSSESGMASGERNR
jgi:hypothetical protein